MLQLPIIDNLLYNVQRQGKISFYVCPLLTYVGACRAHCLVTDDRGGYMLHARKSPETEQFSASMARRPPLLDRPRRWQQTMSECCCTHVHLAINNVCLTEF